MNHKNISALEQMLRYHTTDNKRLSSEKLETLAKALALQPTAVQIYSAAFLIRRGYNYTAILMAANQSRLLKTVLIELRAVIVRCFGGCRSVQFPLSFVHLSRAGDLTYIFYFQRH